MGNAQCSGSIYFQTQEVWERCARDNARVFAGVASAIGALAGGEPLANAIGDVNDASAALASVGLFTVLVIALGTLCTRCMVDSARNSAQQAQATAKKLESNGYTKKEVAKYFIKAQQQKERNEAIEDAAQTIANSEGGNTSGGGALGAFALGAGLATISEAIEKGNVQR